MDAESKQPDYFQAYGETIAADPEFQKLKEEAARRLKASEAEESVLAWLRKETCRHTTRRERLAAADLWLARWILDWAKKGEPGPIYKEARGSVGTVHWRMRKGKAVPMVWAVAGPTSDPKAIAREFLRQCKEAFPDESWMTKETPVRDARWFRQSEEGMEDWDIRAATPKEDQWAGVLTVKQGRARWAAYIKGVTLRATRKRGSV